MLCVNHANQWLFEVVRHLLAGNEGTFGLVGPHDGVAAKTTTGRSGVKVGGVVGFLCGETLYEHSSHKGDGP
jgi:hypothetical protein